MKRIQNARTSAEAIQLLNQIHVTSTSLLTVVLAPLPLQPDPNDPPCSTCGHARSSHDVDPEFLHKTFQCERLMGCTARTENEILDESGMLADEEPIEPGQRVVTLFIPYLDHHYQVILCSCKGFKS